MEHEAAHMRGASEVPRIHKDRSVGEAARLLAQPGIGALMVVDDPKSAEPGVLGLLTERDVFRALAAHGPDIYGHCVWVITDHDFPAIDVASSTEARLQTFCDRKVDHIALMDGVQVSAILSIWDCAGKTGAASRS